MENPDGPAMPAAPSQVPQQADNAVDASYKIVVLDFSTPGFLNISTLIDGQDPQLAALQHCPLAADVAIIGKNVLTQEEVDKLADDHNALVAERDGLQGKLDIMGQNVSDLMDEITMRNGVVADITIENHKLKSKLAACQEACAKATAPIIGIEHPATVDKLPRLDDLPLKPALDTASG